MTDRELLIVLLKNDWVAEGIRGVSRDRYEYAREVAEDNGRDEPTSDDEVEGLKRMVRAGLESSDLE